MVSVAIFISTPIILIRKYYYVFIAAACILAFSLNGMRPEQFTFLFSALYFTLYFRYLKTTRWYYLAFMPLLMILWVNLHGGFFVGLSISFYVSLIKLVQLKDYFKNYQFISSPSKYQVLWLFGVFVIIFLATLVNPYGIHIYREVNNTFFGAIGTGISEWTPAKNWVIISVFATFITFTALSFKKIPLEIILAAYLGLLALFLQKFVSIAIILFLYPLCLGLEDFFKISGTQHISYVFHRAKPWLIFLLLMILLILFRNGLISKWPFPEAAISHVKNNYPGKRMFNNYGWGGYLIANYPEQKVFIDGRMASWVDDYFLAKEYSLVTSGKKPYKELFDKYQVDWAILWIDKDKILINELKVDNWKEDYRDDFAIVLTKN
jgi:hypothetical protein